MKKKILVNDTVVVISGKDCGKKSVVKSCLGVNYIIVEGVNMVNKAVKLNPSRGVSSGFLKKSCRIHRSNVAILNPVSKEKDRVAFVKKDKKTIRVFISNGQIVGV